MSDDDELKLNWVFDIEKGALFELFFLSIYDSFTMVFLDNESSDSDFLNDENHRAAFEGMKESCIWRNYFILPFFVFNKELQDEFFRFCEKYYLEIYRGIGQARIQAVFDEYEKELEAENVSLDSESESEATHSALEETSNSPQSMSMVKEKMMRQCILELQKDASLDVHEVAPGRLN